MMSMNPSDRPSCAEIIEMKTKWLIELKEISDAPLLYEITVNGNHIDKEIMNPLSHYMLYNKLMMGK